MMPLVLAAYESAPYKLVLIVHILAIVAAFGPAFAYAAINRVAHDRGGQAGSAFSATAAQLQAKQVLPSLVVAIVAGIALVLLSDGVYEFSQPWISASFTVVLLILALALFFVMPALKRQSELLDADKTDADELKSVKAMVAMGTGFFHLGLVVLVALMIWKPGL